MRNSDATRRRYSRFGQALLAISAEVTVAGPRRRTLRSYAAAPVGLLTAAGFELLATFRPPHYSVVLPAYNDEVAQRLLDVLGAVRVNPHHLRRGQ